MDAATRSVTASAQPIRLDYSIESMDVGFLLLKLAIVTMLVQSFVVSTVIKGLVLSLLLVLAQIGLDTGSALLGNPHRSIHRQATWFLFFFLAWQAVSQILNVGWMPDLNAVKVVSPEEPTLVLLRKSLFTQSVYLVTCVLFYFYLRLHLARYDSREQLIRLARIGVILFVVYGFYDVIGFSVLHQNVDFLSNRITGEDVVYSKVQTVSLGSFQLLRMKSLASEASMFAFSLLPFLILFCYQRDRIWWLILAAVVLSTSSTAYLGLFAFFLMEAILFGRVKRLVVTLGLAILGFLYLMTTPMGELISFAISKFSLEHASGLIRLDIFQNAIRLWAQSDLLHQLFGIGFGYIRSTDGLATLLVNVGVFGLGAFLWFTLYPLFRMKCNTEYRKALLLAGIVVIITSLVSVSEFFFFQTWFFAALSWHEWSIDKRLLHATTATLDKIPVEASPRAVIVG